MAKKIFVKEIEAKDSFGFDNWVDEAIICPDCGQITRKKGGQSWKVTDSAMEGKEVYFMEEGPDYGRYLLVTEEVVCDECREKREFSQNKETAWRPDSLLQGSIYSHGLATGFAGHKSALEIEQMIGSFEKIEGEVCASWKTQKIGGFGLFIKGEVTVASNMDLWSTLSDTGERIFDPEDYRAEGLFTRRDELDLTQWDHTEFFIKQPKIVAVWCKDWFYRSNKEVRDLVARLRDAGYKVYIVGKRH